MNTIIILFAVSLFALAAIIGIRIIEIRKSKKIVPDGLRFLADDILSKTGLAIRKIIAKIKNHVVRLISAIPHGFKMMTTGAWHRVRDKVDNWIDGWHKKHPKNPGGNKGAMSVYWKEVSEEAGRSKSK